MSQEAKSFGDIIPNTTLPNTLTPAVRLSNSEEEQGEQRAPGTISNRHLIETTDGK